MSPATQEGVFPHHEELLPARPQHGVLLRGQQGHRLHRAQCLRPGGKQDGRQHGVRGALALRRCAADHHPLLPLGHREGVGNADQRPEDQGEYELRVSAGARL